MEENITFPPFIYTERGVIPQIPQREIRNNGDLPNLPARFCAKNKKAFSRAFWRAIYKGSNSLVLRKICALPKIFPWLSSCGHRRKGLKQLPVCPAPTVTLAVPPGTGLGAAVPAQKTRTKKHQSADFGVGRSGGKFTCGVEVYR